MNWRSQLRRWLGVRTVRGIRGAIEVEADTATAMRLAVERLLGALAEENGLRHEEVVSAIFTVTPDLQAAFPATMARELGWGEVPLICASEIAVAGAMPRCLRVLLHVERAWEGNPVRHVYLGGAAVLRPDLVVGAAVPQSGRVWRAPARGDNGANHEHHADRKQDVQQAAAGLLEELDPCPDGEQTNAGNALDRGILLHRRALLQGVSHRGAD